jgi:hypothetical protein
MIIGSEAAVAGLQPGQCILKVNGNNMNHSDYQEVLEHFTSHHDQQDQPDMVRHSLRAELWSSGNTAGSIHTWDSLLGKQGSIPVSSPSDSYCLSTKHSNT